MYIIYGFKSFVKDLLQKAARTCPVCGEVAAVKLVRRRRWFTLFWIPIFPVKSEFFHVCASCETTQGISKDEAKADLAEAKQPE